MSIYEIRKTYLYLVVSPALQLTPATAPCRPANQTLPSLAGDWWWVGPGLAVRVRLE